MTYVSTFVHLRDNTDYRGRGYNEKPHHFYSIDFGAASLYINTERQAELLLEQAALAVAWFKENPIV